MRSPNTCALVLGLGLAFSTGLGAVVHAQSAGTRAGASDGPKFSNAAPSEPVIDVFAVVSDKRAPLTNLSASDFEITADKNAQPIREFVPARELPLTIGLVVDASPAQQSAFEEVRTASSTFLSNLLKDPGKDKAFVIQFGREVDLLQDVTSSKEQIRSAVGQLETDRASAVESVSNAPAQRPGSQTDPRNPRSGDSQGSAQPRQRRASNALYDALFLSSDEIASKQKGRKVLIVLSDGDDSGSKESLGSAIEAAQRTDTVIFAVYYKEKLPSNRGITGITVSNSDYCDGQYPGGYPSGYPYPGGYPEDCPTKLPETQGRPDGKKTLARICDETGGRMFEASKKNDLAEIYQEIVGDLNAQYRLSFVPDKDASSNGFHHIQVALPKKGSKDVTVQSRNGYYIGD